MTRGPDGHGSDALVRPFRVDDLPDDGLETEIEASPEECAAVAVALGLPAVAKLAASFRLSRAQRGRVEVAGELAATVTQVCVVTLEPFESNLTQPIEATFAPAPPAPSPPGRASRRRGAGEHAARSPTTPPAPADPDAPDPIVDGRIDLGALTVEFLALGLDLYPRKPGVHFKDMVIGETDEPRPSAFAALGRLQGSS